MVTKFDNSSTRNYLRWLEEQRHYHSSRNQEYEIRNKSLENIISIKNEDIKSLERDLSDAEGDASYWQDQHDKLVDEIHTMDSKYRLAIETYITERLGTGDIPVWTNDPLIDRLLRVLYE